MNLNFGKINDNQLTYAPNALELADRVILNPTAEQYLACGYKAVNADGPSDPAPTGYHYEADGWAETDTTITRQWRTVADPPTVHRYSKLRLITACKAAGKWDAVKAWIAASGFADEWAACMYLSDDYAGFDQIVAAVVASGIATAEEIADILAASEDNTLPAEG